MATTISKGSKRGEITAVARAICTHLIETTLSGLLVSLTHVEGILSVEEVINSVDRWSREAYKGALIVKKVLLVAILDHPRYTHYNQAAPTVAAFFYGITAEMPSTAN